MPALLGAMGNSYQYTAGVGGGNTPTPAQGSFVSGSGGVNLQTPVANQPFLNPYLPSINAGIMNRINPQPMGANSFISGNGSVNLQGQTPTLGGRGTMIPTAQDRINAQLSTPVIPQRPPAGSRYLGDPVNNPTDKAWVDYWNYQAEFGGVHTGPVVMTKDQIWNMKAQQRRRRQQEAEQDDNNRQAQERGQAATQIKYQPILSQAVTWNIGG